MTTWGITGATGFIGRHLCRRLVEEGDEVVALTRPGGRPASILDSRVSMRTVDLTGLSALDRTLADVEICVHLAVPRREVRVHDGRLRLDGLRSGSRPLMVDAVTALLEAGSRTGLRRLVLASSTAVYGHRWTEVEPHTPPRPDTAYGRDRLAGDEAALSLGPRLGVEIVVARLGEVVGPGSIAHAPLFHAVSRGDFRVLGDGRQPHQVLCVDDAVTALAACGRKAGSAPDPLLVSGPRRTLREWIDLIAASAGVPVRYLPAAGPPARALLRLASALPRTLGGTRRLSWDYLLRPRAYDLTRSLEVLGPYHHADLAETVQSALAWYRDNGFKA